MKKCNMCGSQLPDSYNACPNCGNQNLIADQSVQNQQMGGMQQPMPGPVVQPIDNSKGNIGWAVLGFLIPIVGWVLYFCWKNTKPGNAKMAGIGGIAGFCFNLIVQFIL